MSDEPQPPSALDWPAKHGLAAALLDELRVRARRRRSLRFASAAVALAILGALTWQSPAISSWRKPDRGRIVVSAPTRQTLPDGSVVELRDGADISVDFSGPLRRVTLARGEAHFAVATDLSHPFVVTAAGVSVRAVGTAFTVHMNAATVEVLVTEGRVSVDPAAAPDAATLALVDAGHLAVATPTNAQVTAIAEAQMTDRLAWRVPRVEFSATPLSEAVLLLNRYSTVRLSLADDSLAVLRISGLVRADNADALVRLLVANYEVAAVPQGEHEIILRRR